MSARFLIFFRSHASGRAAAVVDKLLLTDRLIGVTEIHAHMIEIVVKKLLLTDGLKLWNYTLAVLSIGDAIALD